MVALGALLIAIGFVLVIPRGQLPSSTINEAAPFGGLSLSSPTNYPDTQSRRRKLVRLLSGLGVIAVGGLCIAFGT